MDRTHGPRRPASTGADARRPAPRPCPPVAPDHRGCHCARRRGMPLLGPLAEPTASAPRHGSRVVERDDPDDRPHGRPHVGARHDRAPARRRGPTRRPVEPAPPPALRRAAGHDPARGPDRRVRAARRCRRCVRLVGRCHLLPRRRRHQRGHRAASGIDRVGKHGVAHRVGRPRPAGSRLRRPRHERGRPAGIRRRDRDRPGCRRRPGPRLRRDRVRRRRRATRPPRRRRPRPCRRVRP